MLAMIIGSQPDFESVHGLGSNPRRAATSNPRSDVEFDSKNEGVRPPLLVERAMDTRKFDCLPCEVTWWAAGYRSECWICEAEKVYITLNDKVPDER